MSRDRVADERELLRQVGKFLANLEPLQAALDSIYERRLVAFAALATTELQKLADEEQSLQAALKNLLPQRTRILDSARRMGIPAGDLRAVVRLCGSQWPSWEEADRKSFQQLKSRLQRVEARSWKLRKDSWATWHVVRRASREFSDLRTLLSQGSGPRSRGDVELHTSSGGTLLDARV